MSRMQTWILGTLLLAITGCAPVYESISTPPKQSLTQDLYHIQFKPVKMDTRSFVFFELTVANQSASELQIDWHQTRYLHNGQDLGMFVSQDTEPGRARDAERRFQAIAPGQTFCHNIAPLQLVAYATGRYTVFTSGAQHSSFQAGPIPAGRSTLQLVLRQGNQEWTETLSVNISQQEVTQ